MGFTGVGTGLTHKHEARLEKLDSDKNSSLLQTLVNYGRKMFCNIRSNVIKIFTSVIYDFL